MSVPTYYDHHTLERKLSQHLEEIDERREIQFDTTNSRALFPHPEHDSNPASTSSSRPSTSKSGEGFTTRHSMEDLTAVNSRHSLPLPVTQGKDPKGEMDADEDDEIRLERINSQMAEKNDHLPHHQPNDPDLVDWDGPHDPENPQNFTFKRKLALTALIIALTVNV